MGVPSESAGVVVVVIVRLVFNVCGEVRVSRSRSFARAHGLVAKMIVRDGVLIVALVADVSLTMRFRPISFHSMSRRLGREG